MRNHLPRAYQSLIFGPGPRFLSWAWGHPHFGLRRLVDICALYVVASVASAFAGVLLEPLVKGMTDPLYGVVPGVLTPWFVSASFLILAILLILYKKFK